MISLVRSLSDSCPLSPSDCTDDSTGQEREGQVRYARISGTDDDDTIFISQDVDANAIVSVNGQAKLIPREKAMNLLVDAKNGNDVIVFENHQAKLSNVIVMGGEGNDTVRGPSAERATIRGGDGDDTVVCGYARSYVDGGKGNDVIIGSWNTNFIDGGEGNDIIHGGCSDDTLYGGQGRDIIYGSGGNDTAWAVEPGDTVDLGPGDNTFEYIIATPIPPSPVVKEESVSF
jgi:Ca2+-binding RTX toxin-like protein